MWSKRKITVVSLCVCSACILCVAFCASVLSGAVVRSGGRPATSFGAELLQANLPLLATSTPVLSANSAPATGDNIGNILTGIYDGLTFILVLVSIVSIFMAREQSRKAREQADAALEESQRQSKETLELAREQIEQGKLPILIPLSALPQTAVTNQLDYANAEFPFKCLNVGTGVALNIWGVLVPPRRLPQAPFSFSSQAHFLPGLEVSASFRQDQFRFFTEDHTFGEYHPWPSNELTPVNGADYLKYTARLTLTYLDVFGNKHASIYDYTIAGEWKVVKHFRVERSLEDMYKEIEAKLVAQSVVGGAASPPGPAGR